MALRRVSANKQGGARSYISQNGNCSLMLEAPLLCMFCSNHSSLLNIGHKDRPSQSPAGVPWSVI
jgi:hypothetical protein